MRSCFQTFAFNFNLRHYMAVAPVLLLPVLLPLLLLPLLQAPVGRCRLTPG